MAKISVNKSNQATVTIPIEIMSIMGWDGETQVYFIPHLQNSSDSITKETAIIIKEIKDVKNAQK
ncbi:MAG: hypothetical protein IS860_10700 [Nitrosopumilus sp.]|nr:hypothetical protein [Nitrosopumilus sp.]